jgi:protein gp37
MNTTKIDYLTHTWNPLVMRCSRISPACDNCWHLARANMLARNQKILPAHRMIYAGNAPPRINHFSINDPSKKKKPLIIGLQFMGDLFHDSISHWLIDEVFDSMMLARWHTYIMLTKRPENIGSFLDNATPGQRKFFQEKIWLGVTAENQEQADKRITVLLQIPAAVHFVSIEPMLSEIDISRWTINHGYSNSELKEIQLSGAIPFGGYVHGGTGLDWVVLGGETGPGARPMHPDWVRSIRDQCHSAGTSFFFKQWGEFIPENQMYETWGPAKPWYKWLDGSRSYKVGKKSAGHMLDGRAWRQYPR